MIPSFRPQDEIELLQKLAGYLPKDHCNFYVERVSKARAAALSHLNKSDLSTADFAERLRASKECTSSTLMRTDFRAACNGLTEGQRKTDEDMKNIKIRLTEGSAALTKSFRDFHDCQRKLSMQTTHLFSQPNTDKTCTYLLPCQERDELLQKYSQTEHTTHNDSPFQADFPSMEPYKGRIEEALGPLGSFLMDFADEVSADHSNRSARDTIVSAAVKVSVSNLVPGAGPVSIAAHSVSSLGQSIQPDIELHSVQCKEMDNRLPPELLSDDFSFCDGVDTARSLIAVADTASHIIDTVNNALTGVVTQVLDKAGITEQSIANGLDLIKK